MNMLKQPLKRASSGLTLIEVLVTMVITSIGLMGLLSLQMQAMKVTQDAGNYSHSIWIFNDLSNRIKVNRSFSSSYANGLVSCDKVPKPACSNYFDGTDTITSAPCTGPQLAAWDLYEVACGAPRTAITIKGNPIATLPGTPGAPNGPRLTVDCAVAGCDDGDQLLLTLTWRARIDVSEIDGRIRQANDNLITQTMPVNP
jgi:type IV pilus assembly protein PilV